MLGVWPKVNSLALQMEEFLQFDKWFMQLFIGFQTIQGTGGSLPSTVWKLSNDSRKCRNMRPAQGKEYEDEDLPLITTIGHEKYKTSHKKV